MKYLLPSNPRQAAAWFLIVLMLTQIYACRYFKVKQISTEGISTLLRTGSMQKYFIVHGPNDSYELTELNADSTYLYAHAAELSFPVFYNEDRRKRYKKEEKNIIHEVHFFLSPEAAQLDTGATQIALQQIERIDVIEQNTGATVASYVLGGIGIAMGVFTIIGIIALLTKSSCPYVYIHNGQDFIFAGETFGGAIMHNLERDDYMPLPALQAVNGTYQLRITNELKERQFTDLAELIVINHEKGQKILLDKYGNPHTISSAISPQNAIDYSGADLSETLASKDKHVYFFDHQEYSQNGVLLSFPKPADAAVGKLVLTGKNTLWFDYLFGKFTEKFGNRFDTWMEKQSRLPAEDRLRSMQQSDIPLSIFVKIKGEWQLTDYLFTVGPLAARDFVIPIDLSAVEDENVEVKIETGFMFWELDHAAMDFSPNEPMKIHRLSPLFASGTGQMDWAGALAKTDGHYMSQLQVGDVTQLHYTSIECPDTQSQSAFLHTRGYYELIREYNGTPKVSQLLKFRTPGHFSDFSRQSYFEMLGKEEDEALVSVDR